MIRYVTAGSQMCSLVDAANNRRSVPDVEKGEMLLSDFTAVVPYVDNVESELHAKLVRGRWFGAGWEVFSLWSALRPLM